MTLAAERPGLDEGDKARHEHRWSWGIVLLVGSVVIVMTNVFGSGGVFPAVVLAGLMLIHGWIAHKNEYVSPDTKGDGFYYLGLLFTFVSLVPALIRFADALRNTGDVNNALSLIGNFGIALVTTIVGLGGRVFFTMTQDSPGDVATHATQSLEAAINEMTDSVVRGGQRMEALVDHLKRSADKLQKTTEGIASSVEKADSTAADLAAYSANVVKMADAFSDSVDDFRGAVKRGSDSVAGLEERMADTDAPLRGFRSALEETAKTLLTVEATTTEAKAGLSKAQDGAVREIEDMTAQVSALGNEAAGVRDEFEKMTSAFADGAKAATRSLGSVAKSVEKADSTAAALTAYSTKVVKMADAVAELASNVVEAGERIAEATSGIRDVGGRATAASEGLEGMKDAAVLAQSELATVSRAASELHNQLAGPGGEVAERMSAAATQADRAASDLNRLADQIDETQRGLYGITRQSKVVVDKLAEQVRTHRRPWSFARLFKRWR